jgi:hypothetical protein
MKRDHVSRLVFTDREHQVVGGLQWRALELRDDIARPYPGGRGRTACDDTRDDNPRRRVRVQLASNLGVRVSTPSPMNVCATVPVEIAPRRSHSREYA